MNLRSYIPLIAGFLLSALGIPIFMEVYETTENSWIAVAATILYELAVIIGGFIGRVWQKLGGIWADRLADRIDTTSQSIFSDYEKKYLEYMIYQHRVFDVKGLGTQGPFNLELERVYVELGVDAASAHLINSNPITLLPEGLRSGSHTIWEYVTNTNVQSNNYAILGAPGSGKTTLLRHMALALASPKQNDQIPSLLPILLFLRDHQKPMAENPKILLAQLIRDQFADRQAPLPPAGWLEKQLEQGKCLIMLDGLDEVADVSIRKSIVNWVDQCMVSYAKNRFVLSSRPFGYRSNPLSNVTVLQVRPFSTKQQEQFIHNWYLANEIMSSQKDDPGVREDARRGAVDLLKRLGSSSTISEFAVNPLLLTMIATVHRYRSSLPGRRVELYAEICEVFLGKRQEAHGLALDLTPAQKIRVLRQLAFIMMTKEMRVMATNDALRAITKPLGAVSPKAKGEEFLKNVENSSGLLVESENGRYGFSHLTFQEYLTALHIIESRLEKELMEQVNNPWWRETIRLYCAQADASGIISSCLKARTTSSLSLAIECMEEAREVSPEIRGEYQTVMDKGLEDSDAEIRGIVASGYLDNRLVKTSWQRIDDNTFIDGTLVTCAEYQLFIDEMRELGRYYQLDHWVSDQFPTGTALKPILGIRFRDTRMFCEWLSRRVNTEWHFRIPTYSEANQYPLTVSVNNPIGYWTVDLSGEDRFNWIGTTPVNPRNLDRARVHASIFGKDGDASIDEYIIRRGAKAIISYEDLKEDVRRANERNRYLVSELDPFLNDADSQALRLDLIVEQASSYEFIRNFAIDLQLDRDRDRAIARARARGFDINLDQGPTMDLFRGNFLDRIRRIVLEHAHGDARAICYEIFLNIYTLQERIEGRSLAFEGIRLVRERAR